MRIFFQSFVADCNSLSFYSDFNGYWTLGYLDCREWSVLQDSTLKVNMNSFSPYSCKGVDNKGQETETGHNIRIAIHDGDFTITLDAHCATGLFKVNIPTWETAHIQSHTEAISREGIVVGSQTKASESSLRQYAIRTFISSTKFKNDQMNSKWRYTDRTLPNSLGKVLSNPVGNVAIEIDINSVLSKMVT